jgi:dihydroorotase
LYKSDQSVLEPLHGNQIYSARHSFYQHFLIRGRGCTGRGSKYEDNLDDMDGKLTGEKARQFPGVIVGVKSAHFTGPEWKPCDQAVIAGDLANISVIIDYGTHRIERTLLELVSTHPSGRHLHHCFRTPG